MSSVTLEKDLETLRYEVRDWLKENWHGDDDVPWRERVVAAGYAVPSWPEDACGRGLSEEEARAVAAEFEAMGGPGASRGVGDFHENSWIFLAGRPLLTYGTAEQKATLLPKILTGEFSGGCLFYSEPGAGSDLAGLQTRAVLAGDEYVINGQKVWTTGGHLADFALL